MRTPDEKARIEAAQRELDAARRYLEALKAWSGMSESARATAFERGFGANLTPEQRATLERGG